MNQSISFTSLSPPEEQASTLYKVPNMDQVVNRIPQLSIVDDTTQDQSQRRWADSSGCLISDELTYPRSEYKTRFEGTSAFAMLESDYWGTYFRSTFRGGNCDRIAAQKQKYDKTYTNDNTNTPQKNKKTVTATNAGTIKSPWVYDDYKKIFTSGSIGPQKTDKNNDTLLYDQLLNYKKSICRAVIEEFSKVNIQNKRINVYYENGYPCVMVQVHDFHARGSKIKGEISSLYSIVVAYFTGITNYVAKFQNIPIELVNRASFGHNIPSVTETGTSFRINIGIVPKIYAVKVLTTALKLLNTNFLIPLLDKNDSFKLRMNQEELNVQNAIIRSYNYKKEKENVEQWAENDNLFDVLCKAGDSSNRKVSLQITRRNKYIDLLTDYVNEEINDKRDLSQPPNKKDVAQLLDKKDLAQPLRKILKKLDYSGEKAILRVGKKDFNTELTKFDDEECQDIANDAHFWKIIEDINLLFTKHNIHLLSESVKEKKIIGLYSKLERANLEFIKKSDYQGSEDGYGSDSDCDFVIDGEDESIIFHSKKIIVSTGIRAINLAQFLSIVLTRTTKADTKCMYYETSQAIKSVADILQLLNLKRGNSEQEKIRYIDLTHCANNGPDSKIPELSAKSKEQVIVLDYTSATTERISEAIKLIEKVPVLILVCSGLKNEQIGADMNPYGTIRIITLEEKILNYLYFTLKYALAGKEASPKELHNIRKAYKDAGAVVTSARMFNTRYKFLPNSNKAERYNVEGSNFLENFKKMFDLFFTDMYEEELHNLTKIHEQDINEIVSWCLDKIKYLGSSNVKDLVEANSYTFSQIVDSYDEGHELPRSSAIGHVNEDNSVFDHRDVDEIFDINRLI